MIDQDKIKGLPRKTRKDQTIRGILLCGYVETHRSRKYRTFLKNGKTWMVGKAGGLRLCVSRSMTQSRSFTGTKTHLGYAYIGLNCQDEIETDTAINVWRDYYHGEIKDA